jgi:hypothetical protein
MYKVASDRRQRALHHGRPTDWVNGQEKLSPADQLRQMKDGLAILEGRIAATDDAAERRRLGMEKQQLQRDLTAFRAANGLQRKRGAPDGLHHLFVDVAKAMLPKVQFEMIWNATLREYRSGNSRLNATQQLALKATNEKEAS